MNRRRSSLSCDHTDSVARWEVIVISNLVCRLRQAGVSRHSTRSLERRLRSGEIATFDGLHDGGACLGMRLRRVVMSGVIVENNIDFPLAVSRSPTPCSGPA